MDCLRVERKIVVESWKKVERKLLHLYYAFSRSGVLLSGLRLWQAVRFTCGSQKRSKFATAPPGCVSVYLPFIPITFQNGAYFIHGKVRNHCWIWIYVASLLTKAKSHAVLSPLEVQRWSDQICLKKKWSKGSKINDLPVDRSPLPQAHARSSWNPSQRHQFACRTESADLAAFGLP